MLIISGVFWQSFHNLRLLKNFLSAQLSKSINVIEDFLKRKEKEIHFDD